MKDQSLSVVTLICRWLIGTLVISVAAIQLSQAVLADESSPIQTPKSITVHVGVRTDARPFSYIDLTRVSENILPGFGGYSIEVCRHVLRQMQTLPKYQNYVFKATEINAKDRFKELGENGKLFMLCGPDSITNDRLADYRATHAVFLSGMTYAYINPRSPNFPRSRYCENIIGVVRTTTADTQGLPDLASQNLLMRFDRALDLALINDIGRIAESRKRLRKLIVEQIEQTNVVLDEYANRAQHLELTTEETTWMINREIELSAVMKMLEETDSTGLVHAVDELKDRENGLAGKIADFMERQHRLINAEEAKKIVTEECPMGFSELPVRKFNTHDEGITAFCRGDVVYYLADFDILKSKVQEITGCDIVMTRFTRSREVYGIYFPRRDTFQTDPDSKYAATINVAGFYADFNNFLLLSMQSENSENSEIENIFEEEFVDQEMSEDLARFFDSFKINLQNNSITNQ